MKHVFRTRDREKRHLTHTSTHSPFVPLRLLGTEQGLGLQSCWWGWLGCEVGRQEGRVFAAV